MFGTVFGTGDYMEDSDVGYVKIIFMIGLLGLSLILLAHLCIFLKTLNILRIINNFPKKLPASLYTQEMINLYTLLSFIVLLPWFNIKGLYLFQEGFMNS